MYDKYITPVLAQYNKVDLEMSDLPCMAWKYGIQSIWNLPCAT